MFVNNFLIIFVSILLLIGSLLLIISAVINKKQMNQVGKDFRALICSVMSILAFFLCMSIFNQIMTWALGNYMPLISHEINNETVIQLSGRDLLLLISIMSIGILIHFQLVVLMKRSYYFLELFELLVLSSLFVLIMKSFTGSILIYILISSLIIGVLMTWCPILYHKIKKSENEDTSISMGSFITPYFSIILWLTTWLNKNEKTCEERFSLKRKQLKLNLSAWGIIVLLLSTLSLSLLSRLSVKELLLKSSIGQLNQLTLMASEIIWILLGSLIVGAISLVVFYKSYQHVMRIIIQLIQKKCPKVNCATSFVLHLSSSNAQIMIGFIMTLLGSFVTLFYLRYYFDTHALYLPNLIICGLIGVVIARVCDVEGGYVRAILGTFIHGICVTLIPTLCFIMFESTLIGWLIAQAEMFFARQMLDILFIF